MKPSFFPALALLAALLIAGCASGEAESGGEGASSGAAAAAADLPKVTVYKSATCNCCARWVEHMKQNGFTVETMDLPNVQEMKDQLGVPQELRSCHTAYVGGEVLEGHVPADLVKKYLRHDAEKAQGLAVPGMPVGSPGMEMPGRPAEPYEVIAFRGGDLASVYAQR